MRKCHVLYILLALCSAFGISILADRILGTYLNAHGWFFALTPNLTEIHDTSEFTYIATTSAQGVRDNDVTKPKPNGTHNILAIGDSFTFGDGVDTDKTWVEQTETMLQQKGYQVDLINAGKPGATPLTDRQICRAYIDQFDIDAVVYGMYVDDLGQAAYREQQLDQNPLEELAYVYWWPTLHRLSQRIVDYTRFPGAKSGDTVTLSAYNRAEVQKLLKKNPTILMSIDEKFREEFLQGKINPAVVINGLRMPEAFTYILNNDQISFALSAFRLRMQRLRDRCTGNRPVIVVFIPSSDMVSSYYFPFKRELRYTMDDALTSVDLDVSIAPIIQEENFHYVSMLPILRKKNCIDCYYPYDGHMTVTGHTMVAETLTPYVEQILSLFKDPPKR